MHSFFFRGGGSVDPVAAQWPIASTRDGIATDRADSERAHPHRRIGHVET